MCSSATHPGGIPIIIKLMTRILTGSDLGAPCILVCIEIKDKCLLNLVPREAKHQLVYLCVVHPGRYDTQAPASRSLSVETSAFSCSCIVCVQAIYHLVLNL